MSTCLSFHDMRKEEVSEQSGCTQNEMLQEMKWYVVQKSAWYLLTKISLSEALWVSYRAECVQSQPNKKKVPDNLLYNLVSVWTGVLQNLRLHLFKKKSERKNIPELPDVFCMLFTWACRYLEYPEMLLLLFQLFHALAFLLILFNNMSHTK